MKLPSILKTQQNNTLGITLVTIVQFAVRKKKNNQKNPKPVLRMKRWLRELLVEEDPHSIPSTQMATYKSL